MLHSFILTLTVSSLIFASDLKTTFETSGGKQTGRYEEALHLCKAFSVRFSKKVLCENFGFTPEGRPLQYMVVSGDSTLTPALVRLKKRPVFFFQGGIHAGEIDGKDAGFILLRNLLEDRKSVELLKKVTLVFVPVFNVDGHERFGKNNRPNQVGPEEMGFRTTSQNLNLNRDYCKADTPEMQAMLKLMGEWDPILFADLHVTDGAKFQPDVGVMVNPSLKGPRELQEAGKSLSDELIQRLAKEGDKALSFYPSFRVDDDPSSGFEAGVSQPRFSQSYWGLRNRIGILVETHSWKDYARRVKVTGDILWELVQLTAERGPEWRAAAEKADSIDWSGKPMEVMYKNTDKFETISFEGYAYNRRESSISNQMRITYDSSKPETWKVPFYGELVPSLTVQVPRGGYIIPPSDAAWMREKLLLHKIVFKEIRNALPAQKVEAFHASDFKFGKGSFEGRLSLEVQGKWSSETRDLPKGAIFVPVGQARARLLVHLLEPEAPDSFLSWGFFNRVFEHKEYLEDYLTESFAEELLKNPEVKKEFEAKLKEDKEFAKDPRQRLNFFYKKHPSWDSRFAVYPVLRTDRTY